MHFDAIIIGTGQAGPPLADRLDREGLRVAVIERQRIGGTCVNTGCTPTKALVASARAAHMARRAADFGVVVEGAPRVDMARVNARMKRISGRSNQNLTSWLEGMDNVTLVRGHARFTGPRTVAVDGDELTAERIFVNVGTRARVPAMPGIESIEALTNSSIMDVDYLPEHLVIVGGSYIGLEFGQMFRRFGSRVTIVERGPRLIARDDEDVSEAILEILRNEGVDVRLEAECIGFAAADDGVTVQLTCEDGAPEVQGTEVLLAVGRVPNTDDLGLDAAGLQTDDRGFIEVDERLRTSVPGIWALGDCNGRGAFTHTSFNDFEIVAANLLDDDDRRVGDRIDCYGLFIDPPFGRVGMTEREARDSGRDILVGKRPMRHVGRARERSETDGFIKILVDAESDKILGAAILGINGDEAVQTLLPAMYAGAPYTLISRAVHIHPTVAELIPTVLQELRGDGSRGADPVEEPSSEAAVTRRLRRGDEDAFAALVAAHRPAMLRVARLYVRTDASAEEVVQETWLAILRGIDRFEGRSSLKTWVFRILVNIARTRAKRDVRMLTFSDVASDETASEEMSVDPKFFQDARGEQPGHWGAKAPESWGSRPDRELLRGELRAQLDRAIAGLPEAQRLVITLRDVEGWTAAEACSALDVSESNQRVLLHRARTKARRALNSYLRGGPP